MRSLLLGISLFTCLGSVCVGPNEVKQAAEQFASACDPASFTKELLPSAKIDASALRNQLSSMAESVSFLEKVRQHARNNLETREVNETNRLRAVQCLDTIDSQLAGIVFHFSIPTTDAKDFGVYGVPRSIGLAAQRLHAEIQAYRAKLIAGSDPDFPGPTNPPQKTTAETPPVDTEPNPATP